MKTTVKLTQFESKALGQILNDKAVATNKETTLIEIILGNAGIPVPVISIELSGDELIVEQADPTEVVPEVVPGKKVKRLK